MPKSEISDKIIKFANLNTVKTNSFHWKSDAINNSKIAKQLDLLSVEKIDFKGLKNVNYCSTISSACLNADLIILHTEWNDFKLLNFKKLVSKKNFKVYDMRNMYSPTKMKKLNINYFGIGR